MKSIALHHLHLLARMRRNPITQDKVQVVFRKSRNLKEMIVNNRKGCISCDRVLHMNTVTNKEDVHKLRGYHQCQSENCIYCLICLCCNKKYIGETSQTVNNRLRGHESHIKNYHKHPHNPTSYILQLQMSQGLLGLCCSIETIDHIEIINITAVLFK